MKIKKKTYSNLQNRTINKILDIINLEKSDDFPAESELSEKFGVSRTIVRKAIDVLVEKKIIRKNNRKKEIVRPVTPDDYLPVDQEELSAEDQIYRFFLEQIKNGDIRPGTNFSTLQLAEESGYNRTTIRDFLYYFSRFGLIKKAPRKNWCMVKIDREYINELIDVKKTLELDALDSLMMLSHDTDIFDKLKEIAEELATIPGIEEGQCNQISNLESDFFKTVIEVKKNRFTDDFYTRLVFICSIIDFYCLTDGADVVANRQSLIVSLSEHLFNKEREMVIELVNNYYTQIAEIYIEAMELLDFP